MKKFLLKTCITFTIIIVTYILVFSVVKSNLKRTIENSEAIILGDSHTYNLNLPKTFNYSNSGFPYILHYNFAKEFIKQFRGKKIFISYGFLNVSNLYENQFRTTSSQNGWIQHINSELHLFSHLEKAYDYEWINNNNLISKNKITKLYNLNINKNLVNSAKVGSDTMMFNKTLQRHFSYTDSIYPDIIQIKYLTMLIELLKKNECKVILIKTPVTEYYSQNTPISVKNHYYNVLNQLEVKHYDLKKILNNQFDASCFKDADHMNEKGDKIIEEYLRKKLIK